METDAQPFSDILQQDEDSGKRDKIEISFQRSPERVLLSKLDSSSIERSSYPYTLPERGYRSVYQGRSSSRK